MRLTVMYLSFDAADGLVKDVPDTTGGSFFLPVVAANVVGVLEPCAK